MKRYNKYDAIARMKKGVLTGSFSSSDVCRCETIDVYLVIKYTKMYT